MFDLAVRDPGCPIYDPIYGPIYGPRYSPRYGSRHDPIYGQRYSPRYSPTIGQQKRNSTKQKITNDQNEKRIFYFNWDSSKNSIQQQQLHLPGEFKVHHSQVFPQEDDLVQPVGLEAGALVGGHHPRVAEEPLHIGGGGRRSQHPGGGGVRSGPGRGHDC